MQSWLKGDTRQQSPHTPTRQQKITNVLPPLESDQDRFDRALNEVAFLGGAVRLVAWPDKDQSDVPETTAKWGDIATTLRHFVRDTNSAVKLSVTPKGRASEEFLAMWERAERDLLCEGEPPLHEDAMDTLRFPDGGSFHFDEWSEGKPFILVPDAGRANARSLFAKVMKWLMEHIFAAIIATLIGGVLLVLALNYLQLA